MPTVIFPPSTHCDFCFYGKPTVRFRVQTFSQHESGLPEAAITHNLVGDWLACDPCKLLFQPAQLDALFEHVNKIYQRHARAPLRRQSTLTLWRLAHANLESPDPVAL